MQEGESEYIFGLHPYLDVLQEIMIAVFFYYAREAFEGPALITSLQVHQIVLYYEE